MPSTSIYIHTEVWFGWGWILGRFRAYVGPFGGYVGPLLSDFSAMLGHLGLCWRLSGLKFQPQPKHSSVEVEFWVGFGLMLGHLEAILGLCCAILRQSMWAFPAWFWRMSGSCAIYVPKRQLDVEKKMLGETGAEDCKKYVIFRYFLGHRWFNWPVLKGVEPSIPHFFWHRWRNSRFWAMYF